MKRFSFPEHGISIEASNLVEAEKKLHEQLNPKAKEPDVVEKSKSSPSKK